MNVTVRRVRPDEGLLVKDIRLRALLDTPSAFGATHGQEVTRSDEVWHAQAAERSSSVNAATFLAIDGQGAAVGLAGAYRSLELEDSELFDVVSMWSDPVVRGQGVGAALVEHAVEWASAGGAKRVELWVTRGNDAAYRLYERMGFEQTGEHQALPSDPCKSEIRMVRHL